MQGKGLRGRTEEGKEETQKEKKKKAKSRHCKITTKHGWKEGTGLGVSKQGRLELVETYVKNSKRGLGADKAKKKVVNEKPNQSGSSKGNNQQCFLRNHNYRWKKALDITAVSRCSTSDFESGKSETSLSKWARARSMAAKGQGKSSKHLHVEEKEDFIVVDENKKWMHKETKRYYPSSKVSQLSYLQDSLTFNEVALLNEDDTHTSNIRSETKIVPTLADSLHANVTREIEASEPIDTQRLTSSSAPFVNHGQASPLTRRDERRLLHLLSSRDGDFDDMRGYLMVIRTFCHLETASPMTCVGTLWLSAPFVIQKW
ncbi:hypothetical protein JHK87_050370 [Glycine soja]|nr:hypothetical protein JHK87_050370 [Glycine soja]